MTCFICNGARLTQFLDLGNQPPSDAFLRGENLEKPEARYPLSLFFCEDCGLVQLGHVVDPKELFTEYVYTTGMNNSLRANFAALVDTAVARFKLGSGDFAVDIGSNDGTLLKNYAPHGVRVLGVDPSSVALFAQEQGIPTLREFFNERSAQRIVQAYGQAAIITATNVFAHMPDVISFVRGVSLLLSRGGVFISESGYLFDMIETGGYDAVYHEHLRYYSLRPLIRLFSMFGLEVFDVERIQSHSGSIRVFAAREGSYRTEPFVSRLMAEEEKAGLYRVETLLAFGERAQAHRTELSSLLHTLKSEGKRIVGIGAPAKGNTLLNSCAIGIETVDALLEKSPLKIGLYAPGSHIPVKSEELLFTEQPEYALLLSWNLRDELIQKLRSRGYRGKFIIPFPAIRIV